MFVITGPASTVGQAIKGWSIGREKEELSSLYIGHIRYLLRGKLTNAGSWGLHQGNYTHNEILFSAVCFYVCYLYQV